MKTAWQVLMLVGSICAMLTSVREFTLWHLDAAATYCALSLAINVSARLDSEKVK